MNIWIIRNIRFGYKYTITKNIRTQINFCLNNWLEDLINKKSKSNDILIISGGLFSSTSPSLMAIDDAHIFLKKISNKIPVYLIHTDKDNKLFDGIDYSTLDIFSDVENVHIIKDIVNINNLKVIPYNNTNLNDSDFILDANIGMFNNNIIPNIMQLEQDEDEPGVLVFNTNTNKNIIIKNNYSPKHVIYKINNFNELNEIPKSNKDFIHVEIDNDLFQTKKLEINIILHNINATSVKCFDSNSMKKEQDILLSKSLNINDVIYEHIGEDNNLKNHFERILKIYNK